MVEELKKRIADKCGIGVDDIQVNDDDTFEVLGRTYRYTHRSFRLVTDEENPEVTETDKNIVDAIVEYEVGMNMMKYDEYDEK